MNSTLCNRLNSQITIFFIFFLLFFKSIFSYHWPGTTPVQSGTRRPCLWACWDRGGCRGWTRTRLSRWLCPASSLMSAGTWGPRGGSPWFDGPVRSSCWPALPCILASRSSRCAHQAPQARKGEGEFPKGRPGVNIISFQIECPLNVSKCLIEEENEINLFLLLRGIFLLLFRVFLP